MIRSDKLGFVFFIVLQIVFFIIPESLQKPFRILIGMGFFFVFFALYQARKIKLFSIIPFLILFIISIALFIKGSFQSSFLNSFLCLFAFFYIEKLSFEITSFRKRILDILYYLVCFSFIIQFLIFDFRGRPTLSYEINLSGAYLFLFFLYSDSIGKRSGKILIIILSLFMLSRLLIFAIMVFYIVRIGKKLLFSIRTKFSLTFIIFVAYISFSFYTAWYILNFIPTISYQDDISRVVNLNDGSNLIRFSTNAKVLASIGTLDEKLIWGYGDVHGRNYRKVFHAMPHNEVFDFLVEFGLIALLAFAFITVPIFGRYLNYLTLEYYVSLLFYGLFLWIRFLILPSFESIFIFFVLFLHLNRNSNK